MIMYHGTNNLISKIDLSKSRNRVDFGKGFYLTNKIGTARNWAIRKTELEGEGLPTIICYDISPDVYTLRGLRFPEKPDISWLDFICSNRRLSPQNPAANEPRHEYNWISGPIADDKVVDVVAEYMKNEITADKAIARLLALEQTYQLSLHTPTATVYVNEENVSYKQLKKGRWSKVWLKRK